MFYKYIRPLSRGAQWQAKQNTGTKINLSHTHTPLFSPNTPSPSLPIYLQHMTRHGRTLTQYIFPNNQRKQLLHYVALATETQTQRDTEIHAKGHTDRHAHVSARQQKQPFNRMLLLIAAGVVKL